MRNKGFILVCLCVFFQGLSGMVQASDTIRIKTPTYHSEFERTNFENYIATGKADILRLALGLDSTISEQKMPEYNASMKDYVSSISSGISKMTNNKKKIQYIVKTLSHRLFIKYNSTKTLTDFFTAGDFNCVTGSLFYALILDNIDIPYVVKEEPTHVFLLAYPGTFSLPLESTDPAMTIFVPNEDFKNKYVNFLLESKIITKAELTEKGGEAIFNSNYYSDKEISSKELVGLLYYNAAVENFESKNFKTSVEQLEKAYLLYPCDRIHYLLQVSVLATLETAKNNNKDLAVEDMDMLAKLLLYSSQKQYGSVVEDEFSGITYRYLINSNKEAEYEKIYNRLISQIEDSTVKSNLSINYYYQRSRAAAIKGNVEQSWKFITEAYKLNPLNLDNIDYFQTIFIRQMQTLSNKSEFLNIYNAYLTEYPVLAKDVNVTRIGCYYLVRQAVNSFNQSNYKEGAKALAEFEAFIKKHSFTPEPNFVGDIYGAAASYYYRKNDIKSCKAILEKGLAVSPDNEQLVRKYKINITHEIQ